MSENAVDVVELVKQANEQYQARLATIGTPGAGGGAALANTAADINLEGQKAVIIASETAKTQRATADAEAAARFGFTPGAPSATVAALSSEIVAGQANLAESFQAIKEQQSIDPTRNVVGWLAAQIKLPFMAEAHNTRVAEVSQKLDVLRRLASATEDQMKINATVITDAGAAKTEGLTKIAEAAALQAKSDAAFKAAQLGIAGANLRLAVTQDQFKGALAVAQAVDTKINQDMQREGLDIRKKEYDLHVVNQDLDAYRTASQINLRHIQEDMSRIQLGKLEEDVKVEAGINNRIATYAVKLNITPTTVKELNLMGDTPRKRMWEKILSNPESDQGRLGFDAYSSLTMMNEMQVPGAEGINYVRDKLLQIKEQIVQANVKLGRTLKPEEEHVLVQLAFKEQVNKDAAIVPAEGSVYSPPPLISTVAIPAIANLPIVQQLAPLYSGNPRYKTNAQDFIEAALIMMNKDNAAPEAVASQISQVFQSIIALNNSSRSYGTMFLPQMEKFNASISTGLGWGNTKVIDMSSASAVTAFLMRLKLSRTSQELTPIGVAP